MCGIAGVLNLAERPPVDKAVLCRMLGAIRHRGPDEFGIYRDRRIGLGNARLSIIDLSTGSQPISNEDETVWIVYNGEIYNYMRLRRELVGKTFGNRLRYQVVNRLESTFVESRL